jgi:hypothetical protein
MKPQVIAFRPDEATTRSLDAIRRLKPGAETSLILREAVQSYERELTLARIVAACEEAGNRNARVIEEFEAAGDA